MVLKMSAKLRLWVAAGLAALSFSAVAYADTTNFTGDFQAAFWEAQPMAGAVFFTNANSELVVAGPDKPVELVSSIDAVAYNGPTSSGLVMDGTLAFDWEYDSPYGLSDAAYFSITPPIGEPVQILLAQGGGVNITNHFSIELTQGTTFNFTLFSYTPPNKDGSSLTINNFTFQPSVPEPSTSALFVGALVFISGVRRKTRR